MRTWIAALAGLSTGLAVGVAITVASVETSETPAPFSFTHYPARPTPRVKTILVRPEDDRGKPGVVRGIMGQRFFEFPAGEAATRSVDEQLRFQFTAPAEILALDLSVDIGDPRLTLVEFAVGLNSRYGWNRKGRGGFDRGADWLLMASWVHNPYDPGSIDETIRLPAGVRVEAGDFIGLSALLGGVGTGDPLRVSPELLILYRWL